MDVFLLTKNDCRSEAFSPLLTHGHFLLVTFAGFEVENENKKDPYNPFTILSRILPA